MAYWYDSLGYGVFNGMMITHAELLLLRKYNIIIIIN